MLPVTVRNVEPVLSGASTVVRAPSGAAKDAPIPGKVVRVPPGDDLAIVAWFRRLAYANRIEREAPPQGRPLDRQAQRLRRVGVQQCGHAGEDLGAEAAD